MQDWHQPQTAEHKHCSIKEATHFVQAVHSVCPAVAVNMPLHGGEGGEVRVGVQALAFRAGQVS